MTERLSDCLTAPAIVGMAIANAAMGAATAARHARDLQQAQAWVDHLSASAAVADRDFRAVVAALSQVRAEAASLRAALEESDRENLELTLNLRALKAPVH